MQNLSIDQEVLKELVCKTSPYYEERRNLNQSLSIRIGLLGIGLSLGATIAGIVTDNAKISAIFGACAATAQAILFAYPVEKKAGVYRVLYTRNENLRIDLEVRQQTEAELQAILEEFKSLRLQAALEEAMFRRTEPRSTPDRVGEENGAEADQANPAGLGNGIAQPQH